MWRSSLLRSSERTPPHRSASHRHLTNRRWASTISWAEPIRPLVPRHLPNQIQFSRDGSSIGARSAEGQKLNQRLAKEDLVLRFAEACPGSDIANPTIS